MTLSRPSVEEFDAISGLFETLAHWASGQNTTAFLPWTAQWQNLGASTEWAVRLLTHGDGTLQLQAAFQDQIFLDLMSGASATKVWKSVETRLDRDPTSMSKTTDENGIVRENFFDDDKRVAIRFTDVEGVRPWTAVTNLYDEFGQRFEKITDLNDGRQRVDTFENGMRTVTTFTDFSPNDDFDWDSITSEYNAAGQRTKKTTVYDDGSERIESFVNGIRTQVDRTDGGSEAWDTIQVTYSPFGDLDFRTVIYDDGTERFERFVNDQLVQVDQSDVQNAYNWLTIERTYDENGDVKRSQTVFDDGDITIMMYEGGQRSTRIELDADGDENWIYRVSHYDDDGIAGVDTYVEGDEFDFADVTADDTPPPDDPIDPLAPPSFDFSGNDFLV